MQSSAPTSSGLKGNRLANQFPRGNPCGNLTPISERTFCLCQAGTDAAMPMPPRRRQRKIKKKPHFPIIVSHVRIVYKVIILFQKSSKSKTTSFFYFIKQRYALLILK